MMILLLILIFNALAMFITAVAVSARPTRVNISLVIIGTAGFLLRLISIRPARV